MSNYEENKKLVRLSKKANDERYEAHSKTNLKRHIETKFRTTMIGALARFEELFGYLWGHGKQEFELTDEELEQREKWHLARTEILNNGNNQARAALAEIDQHTVRYNKQEYNFLVKKDNQELTHE